MAREKRRFFSHILFRFDEVVALSDEFLHGESRTLFNRNGSLVERGGIRTVTLRTEQDQPLLGPVTGDDVVVDVSALEDCPI
ncbi:hypothetical protein [Halomarina litorea]|uniref:hypothetical protein n=1 Tax=Halomarina litorea TaxID=2961595 RepID=UPI0020C402CD|nr:hypothetical protein [Halomarina sp. BCD28]